MNSFLKFFGGIIIGSGIPRKPRCVLRASCLGQVPGGSAPSCSHACSCASEAPGCSGAAPGRMLSVIWQRPPAAARKNSRCYGFLLLSGAQLLFESHGAPCFSECLYVCLPFVMLKTTLGSQGERNCFLHLRTKQGLARIWDLLTK